MQDVIAADTKHKGINEVALFYQKQYNKLAFHAALF